MQIYLTLSIVLLIVWERCRLMPLLCSLFWPHRKILLHRCASSTKGIRVATTTTSRSEFSLKLLRLPTVLLMIASTTTTPLLATSSSSVTFVIIAPSAHLILMIIGNLFWLDAILVVVSFLMDLIVARSSSHSSPSSAIFASMRLLPPSSPWPSFLFRFFVLLLVLFQILPLIVTSVLLIVRTVLRLDLVQINRELKPTALFSWLCFSENNLERCYLPISINPFTRDILRGDGADLVETWNAMFNHLGNSDCLWNRVSETGDDNFIAIIFLE